MIIHLLFRTSHFGVNNKSWSSRASVFGAPGIQGLLRVRQNYEMMKIRAFSGFIPLNEAIKMFPRYAKKHGYSPIVPEKEKDVSNKKDMEDINV